MTCCSKCEYESISEPGVTKCLDPNCPCHSPKKCCEKCITTYIGSYGTTCWDKNCPCHSKDVEEKVEICGKDIRDDEGFLMAVCHKPKGLCHHFPKDDGLERVLEEFEKYFAGDRDCTHVANCKCKSATVNAIKSFFTQVYQEAYAKGEKEGQARMDNSGRLLFQQGVESERERIRKELPEEKECNCGYACEHLAFNNCLDQVKKII